MESCFISLTSTSQIAWTELPSSRHLHSSSQSVRFQEKLSNKESSEPILAGHHYVISHVCVRLCACAFMFMSVDVHACVCVCVHVSLGPND